MIILCNPDGNLINIEKMRYIKKNRAFERKLKKIGGFEREVKLHIKGKFTNI
jgi:hypothetical protein